MENGADVLLDTSFESFSDPSDSNDLVLETSNGEISSQLTINCAGLQSDIVAKKMGINPKLQIIPFRGEYYNLIPEKKDLSIIMFSPHKKLFSPTIDRKSVV